MIDDVLRIISSLELILCAGLSVAFCFLYHYTTNGMWKKSEMGRHLMSLSGSLALVLVLWVVGRMFGASTQWFRIVLVAAFAAIPYVLGRHLWILLKVQKEDRRIKKAREDNDRNVPGNEL